MTGRTPDEWIGKTPDEPAPPRVRLRVHDRVHGHCQICTREIGPGERHVTDHIIALTNGGANRESNLQCICDWCDRKIKTPADVAEKSLVYRKRAAHLGIRPKRQPMAGSRLSPWKNTFRNGWERRNP